MLILADNVNYYPLRIQAKVSFVIYGKTSMVY